MRALPWIVAGGLAGGLLLLFSRRTEAAPAPAIDDGGQSVGPFTALGEAMMQAAGPNFAQTVDGRQNEEKYRAAIKVAEERHGLPAHLLHRLIYQESRFRSDIIDGRVVSSAGAVGIAQIVPKWHPGVNPLDPFASIEYAADYLRRLRSQFGSWTLALAAYNAGPGNVERYGGIPPFSETQRYVAEITRDVGVA